MKLSSVIWRFASRFIPATKFDVAKIMKELDDLTTEVTNTETVIDSAIVLISNLSALIKAAGTDPVALKQLTDSLDAKRTALDDAVTANTPAAPES